VMRTPRVDIDQARDQLADLIAVASEGGEVIILQDGKPVARLIGATEPAVSKSLARTHTEFSSDEESLAWDAEGWEGIAGVSTCATKSNCHPLTKFAC
jgi:prevent-host-death family protein